MTTRSTLLDRPIAVLLLVAVALLVPAGWMGLLEPTETRYAEIAREMRASDDYLTPRLNGIPHFHKPPLPYWSIAAGFAVLGENAAGARVPAALASILTLVFALMAVRRRFSSASASLTAWVLGTMLLFFVIGRSVASDPFLAAAVAGFWALAGSAWAPLILGVGFMAKGPVVFVMTLLPVLIAAAWGRDRGALRLLGPGRAWGWFALVALPWYLIAVARTPGLLGYFLGDQIWGRYATEMYERNGPPWYFVAVLIAGSLPWTAAFIAGVARLWRERAHQHARLVLCWIFVPLVFLSFSGSKLPSYLLPTLPAVAIIAAVGIERGGAWVRWSTAVILALLAIAGFVAGPIGLAHLAGLDPPTPVPLPPAALVAFGAIALAAVFVARARWSSGAALALVGLTALLFALAPHEGQLGSPRHLVQVLVENRHRGEPVIEYARFNAGLPFYLHERVPMLEVPREPRFATAAERAAALVTRDSLVTWCDEGKRVWMLSQRDWSRALTDSLGLGYRRIAEWQRRELGFAYR